jgi:predicted permease
MFNDVRLALRRCAQSRGFTSVAVLTLAVGIGSATAMFTSLRALVVHPFDYPASDRLVHVWSGDRWPLSPADFRDLREQSTSFRSFGVYQPGSTNIGGDAARAVASVSCTSDVLEAFGVRPKLGRLFTPADEAPGAEWVVVIGHGLWQESFGGDPELIGRSIRLNGGPATVIGIMPESFEFAGPWVRTQDIQLWTTRRFDEEEWQRRDSHYLCALARLKDGVSIEAADAEIKVIGTQLTRLHPNTNTFKHFLVRSLRWEMTRDVGARVWMLFGAVGMVLLVACANIASMLLARSAARQGEFGVRVALGATRGALVRLALAESFVLALGGLFVGLLFAYGGVGVLRAIAPASEARKAAMTVDLTVLGFAVVAMLFTTLIAGLPAVLASVRTNVAGVMREDSRGSVGSRSRHRMLRSLVVAQIAVAFVLANGAAIFSVGYFKLLEDNQSLATEYVLSSRINLLGDRYEGDETRVRLWNELVARVAALPGVTHAGITSKLPLEGGSNTSALVNDEVYDPTQRRTNVERSSVTSDYFATMGMRLLQGRNLTEADDMTKDGHLGVVVSRAMVDKVWSDKDPIGQIFRANQPSDPWYTATVVGVVEDVRQWGASQPAQPEMYTTPPRHWGRSMHLVVRSTRPATFLTPLVARELAAVDGELALQNTRTLAAVVRDATQGERAVAGLVNFFTATALGLVAVGLYGTLSYQMQQRTREIGVRMSLGAVEGDILRLVFRQGARWVACGVCIGIAGTFGLSGVVKGLVYGTEGVPYYLLVPALLVVGAAALAACWLPARRASRVDPLVALRSD